MLGSPWPYIDTLHSLSTLKNGKAKLLFIVSEGSYQFNKLKQCVMLQKYSIYSEI